MDRVPRVEHIRQGRVVASLAGHFSMQRMITGASRAELRPERFGRRRATMPEHRPRQLGDRVGAERRPAGGHVIGERADREHIRFASADFPVSSSGAMYDSSLSTADREAPPRSSWTGCPARCARRPRRSRGARRRSRGRPGRSRVQAGDQPALSVDHDRGIGELRHEPPQRGDRQRAFARQQLAETAPRKQVGHDVITSSCSPKSRTWMMFGCCTWSERASFRKRSRAALQS